MITSTHPATSPEEVLRRLDWLEAFLDRSRAALERSSNDPNTQSKKELLWNLDLLWGATRTMAADLVKFRKLIQEINAAETIEEVKKKISENVYEFD